MGRRTATDCKVKKRRLRYKNMKAVKYCSSSVIEGWAEVSENERGAILRRTDRGKGGREVVDGGEKIERHTETREVSVLNRFGLWSKGAE